MASKKKIIFYIVLIIFISIILSIYGTQIDSLKISEYVSSAGNWGPIIYVIILSIPSIIAPLSGSPIFIAGYLLFGNKIQFYGYLAMLLSSIINFYISKKWGRNFIEKLIGENDMKKVDDFSNDYGTLSLVFLRVFANNLHDFISYAYGLTNMKFSKYLIITILAPIPWLLMWNYLILPRIDGIGEYTLWFFLTLIPVSFITYLYLRFKRKNI